MRLRASLQTLILRDDWPWLDKSLLTHLVQRLPALSHLQLQLTTDFAEPIIQANVPVRQLESVPNSPLPPWPPCIALALS